MTAESVIRTKADLTEAVGTLVNLDLEKPWRFVVEEYKRDRSADQNKLAFAWYKQVSDHLRDRTPGEVRAQMKLEIGVPILRAEDEAFRETYDRVLKHLPYEEKLRVIEVFDIPITRLMTVKQMADYLDQMQRYWAQQGVVLEGDEPPLDDAARAG